MECGAMESICIKMIVQIILYIVHIHIYIHVYIYIDQSMIDMGGSRVDPQVAGHTSLSAV
jgi:hypothetical protein